MSGTLLGVVAPPEKHSCQPPAAHGLAHYQVWRCDCGLAYRLEPQHGGAWVRWVWYADADGGGTAR